jgi:hypothetical protein
MSLIPGRLLILTRVWRITVFALVSIWTAFAFPALAQPSNTATPVAKPIPNKQATATPSKQDWALLTPAQQQALQPLAKSWASLSNGQKRKWLEISLNYPSLSPDDKAKMHSRMSEWAALSPRARAEARLNFASTNELSKQLSPQEKQAKWQAYQSLSNEEKRKLAESGVRPPVGAALPARPVPEKKLATIAPTETAANKLKINPSSASIGQPVLQAE